MEREDSARLVDHMFVAGAKMISALTVGSYTRIGATAVVIDNVQDHATAVGASARIVLRKDREP